MTSEALRSIERKFRSRCINPLICGLQDFLGNYIRWIIDHAEIHKVDELNELFKWKRVAIVWNSPVLENSWLWEDIDNYDVVIRFNRWILDANLDKDNTWLKTTFWSTWALDTLLSFNVKRQIQSVKDKILMLIPIPYEENDFKAVNFNIALLELLKPYKSQDKFYMDLGVYEAACMQVWALPTSWYLVIKYVLEKTVASEIWLFWFSFSSHNRIVWETYAPKHDFKTEEKIVRQLVNDNDRLTLF